MGGKSLNVTVSGGQRWERGLAAPSPWRGEAAASRDIKYLINRAAEFWDKIHAVASVLETKSVSLYRSVLGESLKLMQLRQKMFFEKNQRFIWIKL